MVVRPERLFAAVPRILRCAPDRCRALRGSVQLGRTAKLSNSLAFGWEFELRRRALGTCEGFSCKEYGGAPGEIRTPGLLVRSQALYPTELRARNEQIDINTWRRGRDCSSLRSSSLRFASGPPSLARRCLPPMYRPNLFAIHARG